MRLSLIFAAPVLLLTSCTKKAEQPWLYYSNGAGLNNAVVYVNENPTNEGRAFSRFVIEGVNWIQLKADAGENGYQFQVVKTPALLSPTYTQVIKQEESAAGPVDRRMSFNETKWWHWAWQDADEIKGFDDKDLAEIKTIIRGVIDRTKGPNLTSKDFLLNPKIKMWTEDPKLIAQAEEFTGKAFKEINGYAKLVHRECRPDDLVASVGRQLVMIKAKEGPIFFVGRDEADVPEPKKGELVMNYFFGADEMFFAKFNGQWKWLVPTP